MRVVDNSSQVSAQIEASTVAALKAMGLAAVEKTVDKMQHGYHDAHQNCTFQDGYWKPVPGTHTEFRYSTTCMQRTRKPPSTVDRGRPKRL